MIRVIRLFAEFALKILPVKEPANLLSERPDSGFGRIFYKPVNECPYRECLMKAVTN